jgi:chemotaxis protein histidine kinase CheA
MQQHVAEMTRLASEAIILQESATADSAEAVATAEKANADESESVALQERVGALELEAEELEASAAKDEEGAKILEAKAGEEQIAAETAAARAAADEALADGQDAAAGEAAAAAAEDEFGEMEDGTAMAVCEFIPLVDIICDMMGSVAAVTLHASAVAEVAEAVTSTTAAAAAREDEGAAAAEVTELETAATVDGEAGTALETKLDGEEAESVLDEKEAERDEAEAEALNTEAVEEEELATEEEATSEVEETDAGTSFEKSAQHALSAAQKALLSAGTGLFALGYIGFNFLGRAVGGFTNLSVSLVPSAATSQSSSTNCFGCIPRQMMHDVSYAFLHCLIFVSVFFLMMDHTNIKTYLEGTAMYSIRSEGGLLLIFGLMGATVQCLLLHALPSAFYKSLCWLKLGALFVFLIPLFLLEALIVLVNSRSIEMGSDTAELASRLPVWSIWAFLIVCIAVHLHIFRKGDNDAEELKVASATSLDDLELSEETSLLRGGKKTGVLAVAPGEEDSRTASYSWKSLLLPLELLILSCLVPILASCFSHAHILWPHLHRWTAGYEWVVPLFLVVYVVVLVSIVWYSVHDQHR